MDCQLCSGLPIKTVSLLFLSNLIQAMAFASVFGYLPKLLHHFDYSWTQIGYYQGYIVAEYSIVLCVASLAVERLLQKFEARTIFTAASSIQGFSFLLLAFTTNINMLLCGIFLMSAPAILRVVIEVIVYDISNGDPKQPQYVNYAITTPWNSGIFIGQALGGCLSFLSEQYPSLFAGNSFSTRYLIAAPNLLFAVLSFMTALLSLYILPASNSNNDGDQTQSIGKGRAMTETSPDDIFGFVNQTFELNEIELTEINSFQDIDLYNIETIESTENDKSEMFEMANLGQLNDQPLQLTEQETADTNAIIDLNSDD